MITRINFQEDLRSWQMADAFPSGMWSPLQYRYLLFKSVFEFIFSLVLLVLASPVILLCALLVKLTSSGPAFYWQTRTGKNGRPFKIYKLRSMYHNCESATGPRWSTRGDPRVTPVGRILRRTHLDELPQLWNVVRGDMSLVGPRPERPEFISSLAQVLPHYSDRLLVRPGMTGLRQVQLPSIETTMASVRQQLPYDLYYVRYVSWWLDLCILASTFLYLLRLPLHVLPRLGLVPSFCVVEETYRATTSEDVCMPHGSSLDCILAYDSRQ